MGLREGKGLKGIIDVAFVGRRETNRRGAAVFTTAEQRPGLDMDL
jgi:hypothetical protein